MVTNAGKKMSGEGDRWGLWDWEPNLSQLSAKAYDRALGGWSYMQEGSSKAYNVAQIFWHLWRPNQLLQDRVAQCCPQAYFPESKNLEDWIEQRSDIARVISGMVANLFDYWREHACTLLSDRASHQLAGEVFRRTCLCLESAQFTIEQGDGEEVFFVRLLTEGEVDSVERFQEIYQEKIEKGLSLVLSRGANEASIMAQLMAGGAFAQLWTSWKELSQNVLLNIMRFTLKTQGVEWEIEGSKVDFDLYGEDLLADWLEKYPEYAPHLEALNLPERLRAFLAFQDLLILYVGAGFMEVAVETLQEEEAAEGELSDLDRQELNRNFEHFVDAVMLLFASKESNGGMVEWMFLTGANAFARGAKAINISEECLSTLSREWRRWIA